MHAIIYVVTNALEIMKMRFFYLNNVFKDASPLNQFNENTQELIC